jgi:chorismate mutase
MGITEKKCMKKATKSPIRSGKQQGSRPKVEGIRKMHWTQPAAYRIDGAEVTTRKDTDLDALRAEIDSIDDELVKMLGHRLQACCVVASIKHRANIPIVQPWRVRQVKQHFRRLAKRVGLREELVKHVYELIVAESNALQAISSKISPAPETKVHHRPKGKPSAKQLTCDRVLPGNSKSA